MFIQGAGTAERTYDAIVVGSGITGGWAAKELTERGLRTLVIEGGRDGGDGADYPPAGAGARGRAPLWTERGRHVEHGADSPTEWLQPWELAHRGRGDKQLYERDYPIQSK